jgi:thioredoxin 1
VVIDLTSKNFEELVEKGTKPVIIDVYATWCGPCKQMEPLFEELAKEHGDTYTFTKVNVDQNRDIAIKYGVTSIPTFVFIKDGKMIGKQTGYIAKDDLIEKIKELLG